MRKTPPWGSGLNYRGTTWSQQLSFSTSSFDKVFIYGSHLRKNMTIGKEL